MTAPPPAPPGRPGARPNVLVVQADQYRWDCLGAAGHPDVRTPALDRLAADGVRHTEAYCPYPVCTPSRYSLLSGLYAHQHGAWTNHSTLDPALDTFPRALRRAGYRTAAVGKMHFTPTRLDVGYDRMRLAEQHGPGRYDDDYHRELRAAGLADVVDLLDQELALRPQAPPRYWDTYGTGRSDLPEEWHSTTWIGEHALRELDAWDDGGGQLLHVSFVKPHHPFDPPAPWDARHDPAALTLPPGWTPEIPDADLPHARAYFDYGPLTESVLRTVLAHYYGSIAQLDHHVGRLLDTLRRRGLYDDTLVLFTSDHGEYLGFHHLLLKDGPMYDPLVRVPLLVKYPAAARGGGRRGEVSDAPASLVDVAPTVLAACGVAAPGGLPGRDLAGPGAGHDRVFAEDRRRGRVLMARSRTHKLLLAAEPAEDALYDLTSDPYELTDRLGDPACAGAAAELREALWRWAVFDTAVPSRLDEHAPRVAGAPGPVPAGEPGGDPRAAPRAHDEAAVRRSLAAGGPAAWTAPSAAASPSAAPSTSSGDTHL